MEPRRNFCGSRPGRALRVAELEGTNLEESAIIDHAIKTLSQGATVRVNIPARIYRVYGRQLTVEGADGSRSMVQLFDYKKRFYQIEAKAVPGRNDSNPQSDVVRFHQSLTFTDGKRIRGLLDHRGAAGLRDLALFTTAIDTLLHGQHLLKITVKEVQSRNGSVRSVIEVAQSRRAPPVRCALSRVPDELHLRIGVDAIPERFEQAS